MKYVIAGHRPNGQIMVFSDTTNQGEIFTLNYSKASEYDSLGVASQKLDKLKPVYKGLQLTIENLNW